MIFWPRDGTHISGVSSISRHVLQHWATWEAPQKHYTNWNNQNREDHIFMTPLIWNVHDSYLQTKKIGGYQWLRSVGNVEWLLTGLWRKYLGTWQRWWLQINDILSATKLYTLILCYVDFAVSWWEGWWQSFWVAWPMSSQPLGNYSGINAHIILRCQYQIDMLYKLSMIIFFAAKDGEALYSQQKQDWELTIVAQIMNSLLPHWDVNWRT